MRRAGYEEMIGLRTQGMMALCGGGEKLGYTCYAASRFRFDVSMLDHIEDDGEDFVRVPFLVSSDYLTVGLLTSPSARTSRKASPRTTTHLEQTQRGLKDTYQQTLTLYGRLVAGPIGNVVCEGEADKEKQTRTSSPDPRPVL